MNFGWIGVILFSLFVAHSLRWFALSLDESFPSVWMVYCWMLFNGSLIETTLGDGYLNLFFHGLLVRLEDAPGRAPELAPIRASRS